MRRRSRESCLQQPASRPLFATTTRPSCGLFALQTVCMPGGPRVHGTLLHPCPIVCKRPGQSPTYSSWRPVYCAWPGPRTRVRLPACACGGRPCSANTSVGTSSPSPWVTPRTLIHGHGLAPACLGACPFATTRYVRLQRPRVTNLWASTAQDYCRSAVWSHCCNKLPVLLQRAATLLRPAPYRMGSNPGRCPYIRCSPWSSEVELLGGICESNVARSTVWSKSWAVSGIFAAR